MGNGEYHTVYLEGMLSAAKISKNYQAEIKFRINKNMTIIQGWHNNVTQIEESKIVGLYLGWVVPENGQWQPLMKLTKSNCGYEASHTRVYQELSSKYRGMAEVVSLPTVDGKKISHTIPDIFSVRMPRLRPDTERECKFLGLSYPDIDRIAFIARTGGNIVGDRYDICPIVEATSHGDYQFYCLLQEVDYEIRSLLGTHSKLQCTVGSNQRIVVKVAHSQLGLLPPYFSLLGNGIAGIELVNISDDPYLGNSTLVSVTTKIDLYAHQCFELVAGAAIA